MCVMMTCMASVVDMTSVGKRLDKNWISCWRLMGLNGQKAKGGRKARTGKRQVRECKRERERARAKATMEIEKKNKELGADSEIGNCIGAFCDVARSIGMEVMTIHMGKRKEGGGNGELGDAQRRKPFAKDKQRWTRKLVALIQTFSDNMYVMGYEVKGVDVRQGEASRAGGKKRWK